MSLMPAPYLPPGPEYPHQVTIKPQPGATGHWGQIEIDGVRLYVTEWVKQPDGTVTARGQWAEDQEWRDMLADMGRRLGA